MKKTILVLSMLIGIISTVSCQNKYDFSKIESTTALYELLEQIKQENNSNEIELPQNKYDNTTVRVKGMYYDNVPIISALFSDNMVKIIADTIPNIAKGLLNVVEAKKGIAKPLHGFDDEIDFSWKSETQDTELTIVLVNGEDVNTLGDLDMAFMYLRFKPIYDASLANIHKKIKTFDTQPEYILNIDAYDCVYAIIVNDILVFEETDFREFYLNHYLISESSNVKIVVKPGLLRNGKPAKIFKDGTTFFAQIMEKNSGKIIKEITATNLVGGDPVEFKFHFETKLPYYPEAWANGVDLRNDPDLENKIITLYNKLGMAFLEKDGNTISAMLYQRQLETQQVSFDTSFETAREIWERILYLQEKAVSYEVTKKFNVEFGANGKVIVAYPKNKDGMLNLTTKDGDDTISFDYYLYQPVGSAELKIVR